MLQEYWEEYFWKIHNVMDSGVFQTDYTQPWTDGEVLYIEEGLWAIATYASNTELTFEVGMFPPPYQSTADSEYVCEIPMTEAGPYNPTISVAINIMNPETQGRADYTVDYVVDFMKFCYTNENLSMQVEEVGGVLGATKNCQVPASMTDWIKNPFPMAPSGYSTVMPGFTDTTSTERRALFEEWEFNMIDQESFYQQYDELIYKGLCDYFTENPDNAAAWAEEYGWDASTFDGEPVKPPHMA